MAGRPPPVACQVGIRTGWFGRVAAAERQQKRIALVGAAGFEHASEGAKVECFPWERLGEAKNLADYDVLIVDLLSLNDPGAIDTREFKRLFDAKTVGQILGQGEGVIYVLGDPRFEFSHGTPEARVTEPFLSWTGNRSLYSRDSPIS